MANFLGIAIGILTFLGVMASGELQAITLPTPDTTTPPIIIEDQHPIVVEDQNQYLSDKGNKLIEESLTRPLSKIEKIDFDMSMMSRCVSGFSYGIDKMPQIGHTSDFFLGTVRYYNGCGAGKFVVNFRVNYDQTKLEVITSKGEIVSPEAWLTTYKTMARE